MFANKEQMAWGISWTLEIEKQANEIQISVALLTLNNHIYLTPLMDMFQALVSGRYNHTFEIYTNSFDAIPTAWWRASKI